LGQKIRRLRVVDDKAVYDEFCADFEAEIEGLKMIVSKQVSERILKIEIGLF
jgi:hypothetical protein